MLLVCTPFKKYVRSGLAHPSRIVACPVCHCPQQEVGIGSCLALGTVFFPCQGLECMASAGRRL